MTQEIISRAEDIAVNLNATLNNAVKVLRQGYVWIADPKTDEEVNGNAMIDIAIEALTRASEQADQLETLLFKEKAPA